jgi:hypothetical protein
VPEQVSIINLLMTAIVNRLVDYLQLIPGTDFEEDFETEALAGLIRAGKLQDDPTVLQTNILVHPATKDAPNVLYDSSSVSGMRVSASYEIGGLAPVRWNIRRFHVELRLFFDNELERPVAQTKAQLILSRAEHALHMMNANMAAVGIDTFGEAAHMLQASSSYLREGGGPGTFIWRGEVKVDVLTSLDPVDLYPLDGG